MKVYISLDMEGVAGTLDWNQERTERSIVRRCMTQQMEWVMEGIRASKRNNEIEEIVVADSHSKGDSLGYEFTAVDARLRLISGSPRPCYMMPAMDKSYDVVMLVGYHGGGGTLHGIMDHTYTSSFQKIMVQGQPMSEALMNAALAGYHAVPVGLVIGDEALGMELAKPDQMPWVHYISTKKGLGRFSAINKSLPVVREETIEGVARVLDSDLTKIPCYSFTPPVTLTIEYQTTVMADVAALLPCVRRLDGRTIETVQNDYKELYNIREVLGMLARYAAGL